MKFGPTIFLFLMSITVYAQDCDCESTFAWAKKTFEENDAGFSYTIESVGYNAYEKHSQAIEEKIKEVKHPSECASLIAEWLEFFRSGHLDFQWVGQDDEGEKKDKENSVPENWEVLNLNDNEPERESTSGYAGLWKSLASWDKKIQSILIREGSDGFNGYVLDSEEPNWTRGQLKFSFEKKEGKYKGVYYYPNRSAKNIKEVDLLDNEYLQIGDILLKRIGPTSRSADENPEIKTYVNHFLTKNAVFSQLDESTVMIRIPSFNLSQKKIIDKILEENHDLITSSPNLILDLRNNGGGGDDSYDELIPYLYTNPIRTVGVEILSTPLNNSQIKAYLEMPELDEETREQIEAFYERLVENEGAFVNVFDDVVEVEELESILPNPKEVAIIIDQECGSSTEQFLLAAKQSKKVKLYGRTTFGALDISNMNVVESPCKQFVLGYAMSRTMRIPGMSIDGKGIQPDFYIDSSIPKYKWVDFVREMMSR